MGDGLSGIPLKDIGNGPWGCWPFIIAFLVFLFMIFAAGVAVGAALGSLWK